MTLIIQNTAICLYQRSQTTYLWCLALKIAPQKQESVAKPHFPAFEGQFDQKLL
jgi:hypothetical protein